MNKSDFKEKTTSSQLIYDGKIMQVYCDDIVLPDGKPSKREYVRHSGGAGVLAVDDEGFVYLVSQFRYPYGKNTIEIPAGKRERGEDPRVCAERELEEETGLKADRIELLATVYPTPAYTDEVLYVYLATGLRNVRSHLDDGEFLNVRKMKFEDALALADSGAVNDSKTLIAIYKYALMRRSNTR